RQAVDDVLHFTLAVHGHLLDDRPVSTRWCPYHPERHEERRTGAQRQERWPTMRRRRTAEKGDEYTPALRILVRYERHHPPRSQRTHPLARRHLPWDHPHPQPLPRLYHQPVEERVRLPLRHHIDRYPPHGKCRAADLPVPQMTR